MEQDRNIATSFYTTENIS